MTGSNFIFSVICLSVLFPLKIQAQSLKLVRISSNTSHVDLGKTLILNATYTYTGTGGVGVIWRIGATKVLVEQIRGGSLDIVDSRASIEGRATLVLKNTTLSDNGIYALKGSISGYTSPDETFTVIIQVKSIANVTCPFVNITEGENFSCICSGVGGSPPPTAYWLKDNNVSAMGYRSALLEIRNISKKDTGTYTCRVKSGTLTDEKPVNITVFDKPVVDVTCKTSESIKEGENFSCTCSGNDGSPLPSVMWLKGNKKLITVDNILKLPNISNLNNGTYVCRVQSGNLWEEKRVDVTVLYEPRNIYFSSKEVNNTVTSGYTVKITCKADAFPEASYSISFNGSQLLTDDVNGVYTISSVNDSHAGNYTCVANNTLGSVSSHFVLTVKVRPTSTLIMPTRTVNPSASTSTAVPATKKPGAPPGDKESNIAPIVGGAIGGVVFLIICIVLIWYCCCKRSASGSCKGGNGGGEDIVVNPANPSYAAMGDSMDRGNAYESVDQAKVDQARDDESGPSNENPPDAGNSLPPVYAVVNKSKKTPKPPPEKQPDSLTYASLDPVVLQPDSSKMRDRPREETNYASIDLLKLQKDQE